MKIILLLILFIVLGCIPHRSRVSSEKQAGKKLSSSFTAEEKKIDGCLSSIKFKCGDEKCEREEERQCLKGTSYAQKRQPSSAQRMAKMQMVEANAWLFESQVNMGIFLDVLQGLIRAHGDMKEVFKNIRGRAENFVHGRGVAVQGSAYFGIGRSWMAEVIHHDKNIALFCAPGTMLTTDIGVDPIGIAGVSTLNCPTNRNYEGTFLSAGVGVSGEVLLVPASAQIAYSFGFDSKKFRDQFKQVTNGSVRSNQVFREYQTLLTSEDFADHNKKFILSSLGKFLNFIFPNARERANPAFEMQGFDMRSLMFRKTSFGQLSKDYFSSQSYLRILRRHNLEALEKISKLISDSLTGCDAIAGAASISISASPVNATLMHSYYTKMLEINLEKILSLQNVNAFLLSNPYLLDLESMRTVVELGWIMVTLPSQVRTCNRNQTNDLNLLLGM